MEAKKRITIKALSEEFNKEITSLKTRIDILEKQATTAEDKVKLLEAKLAKEQEQNKGSICSETFVNMTDMSSHSQGKHSNTSETEHFKRKCKFCKILFLKNSDLEAHVKRDHSENSQHECDICEKTFVLKWRLKKHKEGHESNLKKFCHYFNNDKTCPFEEIGCMFFHQDSESCKYGDNCQNGLCQFKHGKETTDDAININDLKENFDKLSEEEKLESTDFLCSIYCKSYEYHRCTQEHFELFMGCDVMNITEDFVDDDEEDIATFYPCDKCEQKFVDHDKLRVHFSENHIQEEYIKCSVNECSFQAQTINVLTMHIGVDHFELVKGRLYN